MQLEKMKQIKHMNSKTYLSNFIDEYLTVSHLHLKPSDWQKFQTKVIPAVKVVGNDKELYIVLPNSNFNYENMINDGFSFSVCYLMKSTTQLKIKGLHVSCNNKLDPNYTNFMDDWENSKNLPMGETPPLWPEEDFH